MGACFVEDTAIGTSPQAAWQKVYRAARDENGWDPYSGSLATCSFNGGVVKHFDGNATKANIKAAQKIVREYDRNCRARKWTAYCIDCGVQKYAVVSAKASRPKGRPVSKYEVAYGDNITRVFAKFDDAKAFASEKCFDDGCASIRKVAVYPDGSTNCIRYTTVEKTYKSRPKKIPKNAKLFEYHYYVFFGLAAS